MLGIVASPLVVPLGHLVELRLCSFFEAMPRVYWILLLFLWTCVSAGCRPDQEREEALSALEETAALDRADVLITNPDCLAPALSYIPRHGTDKQKMMLWYYLGRIQTNGGDFGAASLSFERAEALEDIVGDPHLTGLVNRAYAGVFNWMYDVREDSLHLLKAIRAFDAAGDTLHAAEAGLRLAVAFCSDREWDKSYAQFMRVRSMAMKHDMLAFRYRLCLASFLATAPDEYDDLDALTLFEEARTFNPSLPVDNAIDYGYILALSGRENEGLHIWDSLERAHPEGLMNLDYKRYSYLEQKGRFEEASFYLDRVVQRHDSVLLARISDLAGNSQRNYLETMAREEREERERARNLQAGILSGSIFLIITMLLAGMAVYQNERSKRLESQHVLEDTRRLVSRLEDAEKKYLMRIHTLSRDVRNTRSALDAARSDYLYLFRSSYRKLGELFEARYYAKSEVSLSKKVADILKSINGGPGSNLQLLQFIEDKLDRPVTHLREDLVDLKEEEVWLFCYLVIGYDASLISLLMEVGSINTVYSRKKRLLERIKRLPPAKAKRYLDLID